MEEQRQRKPHLKALTGLRFFAAIYVVLFHHANAALSTFPKFISRFFQYGYTSVSLFFVLSGFVLAYTYLDSQGSSAINSRHFWIARFARIYPLYVLALIVSAPGFIAKLSELGELRFFLTAVSTISLLQAWTPWTATVWNTPLWAVSVEAFCYLLFPFFANSINRFSSKAIFLLALILWLIALIAPSLSPSEPYRWMTFVFTIYAPIFHVPQFIIGICTAIIFLRKNSLRNRSIQIFSKDYFLPVFLAIALLLAGLIQAFNVPYQFLNNGLISPIFALIIFALASGEGTIARFLSLPVFMLLGEASYAIYIFQNPLLSCLKMILSKAERLGIVSSNLFDSLPFLLGYLTILISLSIFASRLIEVPLRKAVIFKLSKRKN